MKKLLLIVLLAVCAQAQAQLKSINEFAGWGAISYKQLETILSKGYWKVLENGKMDTLNYIRWIPKDINEKNMGDCVMAFFKKKDMPLDYIIYQTINKNVYEQYKAEAKKSGFEFKNSEKKADKSTEYYSRGIVGLSIITGKEKPDNPLMYIFGIKMLAPAILPSKAKPLTQVKKPKK